MTTQTTSQLKNQPRTRTIHRNDPFVCKNCKEPNPPAKIGCRNHCRNCLYSLHVDENTPGDRLSTCLGFMEPLDIEQNAKKGFKILHRCRGQSPRAEAGGSATAGAYKKPCKKMMWNKVADDDDLYLITHLIKLHNERNKKIERRNGTDEKRSKRRFR